MSPLAIQNPATGELITRVPADDAATIAARLACIERFRAPATGTPAWA